MATITTRLGPLDHGRQMTLEEFQEAEVEEGYRYELARGVFEVTNLADYPHRLIVCNMYRLAVVYEQANPRIIAEFGGGGDFSLEIPNLSSVRHPDFAIALVDAPRDAKREPRPALAAEVVSGRSRERDYQIKREEYLAYGLAEYWIVDFPSRRLTVLIRNGEQWDEQVCVDNQMVPSAVLPGLTARVSDLWVGIKVKADND